MCFSPLTSIVGHLCLLSSMAATQVVFLSLKHSYKHIHTHKHWRLCELAGCLVVWSPVSGGRGAACGSAPGERRLFKNRELWQAWVTALSAPGGGESKRKQYTTLSLLCLPTHKRMFVMATFFGKYCAVCSSSSVSIRERLDVIYSGVKYDDVSLYDNVPYSRPTVCVCSHKRFIFSSWLLLVYK